MAPEIVLTDTFDPLQTPLPEVKKCNQWNSAFSPSDLKALGFSTAGRVADLRKAFATAILQAASVPALKSALKARGKAANGNKGELAAQLLNLLLNIEESPPLGWNPYFCSNLVVDINLARLEELSKLPGLGPKLSERIIEHRPYKDIFQVKEKVPGFGADKIKMVSHLLTGWIVGTR